jgi:predicted ATPase
VISKITIKGFKSLRDVSLELGKLNLFIGTNASGKSNFFDALRVLQGISNGLMVDEIFNGKPKGATNEVWAGIRGGSAQAGFLSNGTRAEISMAVKFTTRESDTPWSYSVEISPLREAITHWRLCLGTETLHESSDPTPEPPLAGMPPISDVQLFEFSPAVLREYSSSQRALRMGERGENFAALVKSILAEPGTASAYLSWLKQLTPAELDEVVILPGALQEPLLAFKREGEIFPSPVLSDGTLRFAAIAAAFFQPDMPQMLMIEEIENGIHPARLRLLVELLKSQTQGSGPQTMVTTHSPLVLAWLKPEDYKTTFFCQKDESTGASTITPLSEIPHFAEIVKKQPVSDLFAEGWLETAL